MTPDSTYVNLIVAFGTLSVIRTLSSDTLSFNGSFCLLSVIIP